MKDYSVQPIKREDAVPWINLLHYAKRIPAISFSYGLYQGNILVGVISYGVPASPNLCTGVCGENYKNLVLELNRLCLKNNRKNEASFLIASSLRILPAPKILVSYADTGMNHVGYIYQATNWIYTGITDYGRKPRPDRIKPGSNKHGRHEKDNAIELVYRTQKHRYIFFIGSKKFKKEMKSKLNYPILPYPKGESKRYDTSCEFPRQVQMF